MNKRLLKRKACLVAAQLIEAGLAGSAFKKEFRASAFELVAELRRRGGQLALGGGNRMSSRTEERTGQLRLGEEP